MADFRDITAQRLADEIEQRGFNQSSFARAVGIGQPAINNILHGRTSHSRFIPKIAEFLGVTPGWLMGTSDVRESPSAGLHYEDMAREMNSVLVPVVSMRYAMGPGAFDDDLSVHRVPVPVDWLRPMLRGTLDRAFIATPEGDSMEPTIRSGEPVIVDRSQKRIAAQDAIWCVTMGELGMIKRVRARSDGGYDLVSDNPAVPPMAVHDGEMHVIGRVVAVVRRL